MVEKNPIKAIRLRCLDCCAGALGEVENCPIKDCSLWWFRFGTNPFKDGTYDKFHTIEKEQAKKIRLEEQAKLKEQKKQAKSAERTKQREQANLNKLMNKPGKITVNKDGVGKRIDRSNLMMYLNDGWKIGTTKSKEK